MSISVTFTNQPSTKVSLEIVERISKSKFEVYGVYSPSQKAEYALKVFPKGSYADAQYQKEKVMFNLSHKNIIQSFPTTSVFKGASAARFNAIITEFLQYGDLFDLVTGGLFDSEILIRTYFHQLIEGLEYMHSKGVAHLDLKLENLMMGDDCTLKIIDFDQAQKTTDKTLTSGGTKQFRAPEVIEGKCRNMTAADIYSAGIILYAFKAQSTPFSEVTIPTKDNKTTTTLHYYAEFLTQNSKFWDIKSKNNKEFFSAEFRELMNGMLRYEPEKRFNIIDIKQSKWYNGPILDARRLKSEMSAKLEAFFKE